MKSIRLFFVFCTALLSACTYHNKLPRDIFAAPAADPRIYKSVLLVSDKVSQKQFVLKDYHASNSVHSYKIDLKDGSLIAAAEALGTLFDTVEVNPSKHAASYDLRAELDYTVRGPKADNLESVQWLGGQPPILETQVMISLYDTQTNKLVFSMFASRQNRVELSNASAVTQRVESKGQTLLLPITGPVYTQQFGDDLRYTLSRDLVACLTDISQSLQQNRTLFESYPKNNVELDISSF